MLRTIKRRVETGALVTALVAPLALCVFGFLSLAAYLSFRQALPANLAALVTAACGIVLIAAIFLVVKLAGGTSGSRKRQAQSPPGEIELGDDLEDYLREHVDPVMGDWVRKHPDRAAIVTLGLGIAAGYSDQFRRVLMDVYARYAESESVRRSRRH